MRWSHLRLSLLDNQHVWNEARMRVFWGKRWSADHVQPKRASAGRQGHATYYCGAP